MPVDAFTKLTGLTDEIKDNNKVTGFVSIQEGFERSHILDLFLEHSLKPIDILLEMYTEFSSYKFEWNLALNITLPNYLDEEMDIVSGWCNIHLLQEALTIFREENVFVFEASEEEYKIGLSIRESQIKDQVQLFDYSEEEWRDLNMTLAEYLELLVLTKGFVGWQYAALDATSRERILLMHYLPQVFSVVPDAIFN